MTQLVEAVSRRLEEILDGTYPVWGEGLSRRAYGAWNRAQMRTAWGRDHLRRVALLDDETLLASAKRYEFEARVGAETVSVLGIGAVFTPADRRSRGHARVLIDRMIDEAGERGCRYALLFSEIGSAYYEALGFRTVARTVVSLEVSRKTGAGAPATFVRSGDSADMTWIAEISARYGDGAAFTLNRSPDQIAFGIARRRLLAGLGPAGLRQAEFFVAEEGHRPVAYVFITRGPAGLMLEECGDRDPSGARIGAILQVLAARTPADPAMRLSTWLPHALRPPQVHVRAEAPAKEIMMIRPIGAAPSPVTGETRIVYWQTDVF